MGTSPTVERTRIRQPRSEVLLELRRRELRRERQEFGGQIQWEAAFFGHRAVDRAGTEEFEAVPPPHPKRESEDEPESNSETETETKTQIT